MAHHIPFKHRHKEFELRLDDEGTFELYLDNCLRKSRPNSGKEPQYLWTNVELEWEEHHYVEARYWASRDQVEVTVNGAPLLQANFKTA